MEKSTGKIVKRKAFEMKPMFEEEAIMQMEQLNHQTYLYFDAVKEKVVMIYRRKDNNYGLIERFE